MSIPSHFKALDQDVTRKLLDGQVDILAPAVEERDDVYRSASCPSCGSKSLSIRQKKLNSAELVPYHHLVCSVCGCVFDPKSNLILKDGVEIINSELTQ